MLDHRIPFEIFQKIIKLCLVPSVTQRTDSVNSASDGIGLRPPIKMSHVCRSWRTTLLSDPTLWACLTIPKMKLDQLKEFIHRSGSVPLIVVISFTYEIAFNLPTQWYGSLPKTFALVFQEMHRIQMLEFITVHNPYRSMDNVLKGILQYLKQPAPMLQTLYVAAECWIENAGVLQTLFSGHAPHLKDIHYQIINGFQELSFSPLLQNLSSLHLRLCASVIIDRDILLDVLELLPCLRVFDLISPWDTKIAPHMVSSDRRVSLPRLQLLMLQGNSMTTVANFILEHLKFPFESVRYSIDICQDFQCKKSVSAPLIQFLGQRRHTSLFLSVFFHSERFEIYLKLSETYPYEMECSVFGTIYQSLHEPVDKFPIFRQTFKLSDIIHLRLIGAPLGTNILRNVFILLVNLEHLVVEHVPLLQTSSPTPFLLALMPQWPNFQERAAGLEEETKNKLGYNQNISKLDNTGSSIFPCPSLFTLKIKFFPNSTSKLDKPYAQAIAKCCSVRRHAGYPFTSISIYRLPDSSTQEAESMLLHNEDCPIDILMIVGTPQK